MKTIEVVAAVIIEGGRIFATQRGYGEFKDFWEFPGGKIEPGEDHEHALKREIIEELNTEINIENYLCTIEHDYPTFHLTMHTYTCTIKTGTPTLLEHEASRWLTPDQLDQLNWLPADIKILQTLKKQ